MDRPDRREGIIRDPWVILALLVIATAVNLMDRQLPFIMAEPIKHEFALSDTQLGLLGGLAFSFVYAFGALPMARLADHRSRRWVLAGAMVIWSVCTAFGGLARSFPQLMASRAGVAVGEAAAAPTSHSLISDLFPTKRRGFAMAVHTAGIPVGVMLGLALGGLLLEHLHWRTVLLLAAIPGTVLALIFAILVREPPRIGAYLSEQLPPFAVAVKTLWFQRSFVWLTIGATLCSFATSGGATFGPSFFIRTHGLSMGQAGVLFGLLMGGGGMFGGLMAGGLSDRLTRADPRWMLWIPAIGALVQTPLYVAAWMVGGLWLAAPILFAAWIAGSSYLPLSYAATQSIAAPRMRAFSSAMIQLVLNLVGNVSGPLFVGYLSDTLHPAFGVRALGMALAICAVSLLAGSACFFRAASRLRRDQQNAAQLAASPGSAVGAMLIPEEV
jgi:predicted MFS family arabinose efflux permease